MLSLLALLVLGAPAPELATDAGVTAAFRAARDPLGAADLCIRRPATFPGVIAVAEDIGPGEGQAFGCELQAVFVGTQLHDPADAAAAALAAKGWKPARPDERARLALAWAKEVVLAFERVTDTPTPLFANLPGVHAPRTEPTADGGVTVTLWSVPTYPGPVDYLRRWRVRFAADGRVAEATVLVQEERERHPVGELQ